MSLDDIWLIWHNALQKFRIKINKSEKLSIMYKPSHSGAKPPIDETTYAYIHSGTKPRLKCINCEKTFGYTMSLKNHKCTGHKPYKCDDCELSYNHLGRLNYHKQMHVGVKCYKCDICETSFEQRIHLKAHKLIHKLKQQEQQAEFNQLQNLQQHQAIDSNAKPFRCNICETTFKCRDEFRRHQVKHMMGEKLYKCTVCEELFSSPRTLKQHKVIHTEAKDIQCSMEVEGFKIKIKEEDPLDISVVIE